MNKHFVRIVEENVDGCGGNAEVCVRFDRTLTQEELSQLKQCLDTVKAEGEELDTDTMVDDALTKFAESGGPKGCFCEPYESVLYF